jgi:Anti-sigma-K factor rskA
VDTPVNHGEYEELAAGYVLGALEPDDEHVFQRHLGGCRVCEANVRELAAVAARLADAVPPVEPPDTVWAGIRREIREDAARGRIPGAPWPPGPRPTSSGPPAPDPPGRPSPDRLGPRGRGAWLLGGLAAAAALLVVALSIWNLALRDQNAAYRDRVAALERAAELINEPNAALVALDDAPGAGEGRATVVASTRQDRGVLLVEDLPALQRGRVYELWGVPEGRIERAQKAVVFIPLRRQGVQTLEFEVPIQPGTVFAITDEPGPTGSEKPTTQPLLVGKPTTA